MNRGPGKSSSFPDLDKFWSIFSNFNIVINFIVFLYGWLLYVEKREIEANPGLTVFSRG